MNEMERRNGKDEMREFFFEINKKEIREHPKGA